MGCGTSKMTLHESRQGHQTSSGFRPIIQRRLDDIRRLAGPTVTRLHTITRKEELPPQVIEHEEETSSTVKTYYSAATTPINDHVNPHHDDGKDNKEVKEVNSLSDETGKEMEEESELMMVKEVKKRTEVSEDGENKPENDNEDDDEEEECDNGSEVDEEDGRRQDYIWESLSSPSFRVYCTDSGELSSRSHDSVEELEEVEQVQFPHHVKSISDDVRMERQVSDQGSFDESSSDSKKGEKKKSVHKRMRRRFKTFASMGGIMHLHSQNKHLLQKSATLN